MTAIPIMTRRVRRWVLLFVIAFCQGCHRDDLHGLDITPKGQIQEFPNVIIAEMFYPIIKVCISLSYVGGSSEAMFIAIAAMTCGQGPRRLQGLKAI